MELKKISCFMLKTTLLFDYFREYFFYKITCEKKRILKKKIKDIFSLVLNKKEIDLFNQSLKDIKCSLNEDALFSYKNDPSFHSLEEAILTSNGLYAIMIYRIANSLSNLNIKIIPRLLSEYAHSKTGIDIHPEATIGRNFFIDHGTGVVIGSTTNIGNNVKIYHGVTLGAKSINEKTNNIKRHPTIEDDVTIYCHSIILGGDTIIGKGSIIGANKVVKESIPENSKVI